MQLAIFVRKLPRIGSRDKALGSSPFGLPFTQFGDFAQNSLSLRLHFDTVEFLTLATAMWAASLLEAGPTTVFQALQNLFKEPNALRLFLMVPPLQNQPGVGLP